jgi:Ca2+/Na+ antiporter
MALVGLAAIGFAKRREQGRELRVHTPTLKRDLLVFLALLGAALLLGLGLPSPVRVPAALALVLAYAGYVAVTVRRGGQVPDTLALGNITGAMVFQSTIPIAFGLAFTSWHLDWRALLAAGLALAGGAVAVWALHVRCRFSLLAILLWVALFAVFATAVAAT